MVLAGLVDTSGYSTAVAGEIPGISDHRNQAQLLTEPRLIREQYGFGFKDGKFMVMNVASTDLLSVASQNDDKFKHPVPLKIEKDGDGYRLYAGRKYVVLKAD